MINIKFQKTGNNINIQDFKPGDIVVDKNNCHFLVFYDFNRECNDIIYIDSNTIEYCKDNIKNIILIRKVGRITITE